MASDDVARVRDLLTKLGCVDGDWKDDEIREELAALPAPTAAAAQPASGELLADIVKWRDELESSADNIPAAGPGPLWTAGVLAARAEVVGRLSEWISAERERQAKAVPAGVLAKAKRVVALHAASGELTNDALSVARWVLSIAGGTDE